MDVKVSDPNSGSGGTGGGEIREVSLEEALGERYLAYALATITARSLPDARDGLKPVHRRLLFAMRELNLDPRSSFKKCARVVGDVIGKFHPHGEQAVYDAMVRLAQDFAARYPLVDGQGNFGNVDGDGAAAMRYTEARLTAVAEALLEGIGEDAVDLRPTYDGAEEEPDVLPAAFPNLLANGAAGIAVGMATAIPPHNVGELCAALVHLIKYPRATAAKLVDLVPGPDFPTGGLLVESREQIIDAYRTGRGGFRLRAKWKTEKEARGVYLIVVTEIPFQVAKSRLVERIAELINARKLPLLGDVRDESAEDIRLVLEPKSRSVDAKRLDGGPVPGHRSGGAGAFEPECSGSRPGAGCVGFARRITGVPGSPPGGSGPPHTAPPGQGRRSVGSDVRVSGGLLEPGRGHPHHP